MSESEEWAKTGAEIAKFSKTSVEASEKFGSFLARILDEPLNDAIGIFGDKLKFIRWKNKLKINDEVSRELDERGVYVVRPISPKLAVPILEYACLEEDEYLQNIWCKLIANSLDPNFQVEIRFAFIDILRNLTPLDAKILKYIYENLPDKSNLHKITDYNENKVNTDDIIKNINAQESDVYVSLFNLRRVQCIWNYDSYKKNEITKTVAYIFNRGINYTLTPLGCLLVEVCMK